MKCLFLRNFAELFLESLWSYKPKASCNLKNILKSLFSIKHKLPVLETLLYLPSEFISKQADYLELPRNNWQVHTRHILLCTTVVKLSNQHTYSNCIQMKSHLFWNTFCNYPNSPCSHLSKSVSLYHILMKVKEENKNLDLKLFRKVISWHPIPSLHGK